MQHLLKNHIETISQLSEEDFPYILSHFVFKKLKKHAFLVQEGEQVRYEYFVLKGCLKAYIAEPATGKEFIY